jgi:hypothetical protein
MPFGTALLCFDKARPAQPNEYRAEETVHPEDLCPLAKWVFPYALISDRVSALGNAHPVRNTKIHIEIETLLFRIGFLFWKWIRFTLDTLAFRNGFFYPIDSCVTRFGGAHHSDSPIIFGMSRGQAGEYEAQSEWGLSGVVRTMVHLGGGPARRRGFA